jgi:hypothetical protein
MEVSKEWTEGRLAANNPNSATNPYKPLTLEWIDWGDGLIYGLLEIIEAGRGEHT